MLKKDLSFFRKENLFGKIDNMLNTKDILTKYKNIALVGASKDLKNFNNSNEVFAKVWL